MSLVVSTLPFALGKTVVTVGVMVVVLIVVVSTLSLVVENTVETVEISVIYRQMDISQIPPK